MISVLDDLQSSGLDAIDTHWRPNVVIQDKRTPSQWAIDERYIGRGASPLSKNGDLKYNFDICPWVREPTDTPLDRTVQVMVLQWASSMMKALAVDTPIPTVEGWQTMGNLKVGDSLFDEKGRQCRVVVVKELMLGRPCMKVCFDDGTHIIADEDHDWITIQSIRRSKGSHTKRKRWIERVAGKRTTKQIADTLKAFGQNAHAIPIAEPLLLPVTHHFISPYVLGLWLGDGDHAVARIAASRKDAKELIQLIEEEGHLAKSRLYPGRCADIKIDDKIPGHRFNSFIQAIRNLGLFRNKHIPASMLRASYHERHALFQGLMDSDGSIDKNGIASFTSTREKLCRQTLELARSLGLKATIRRGVSRCQNGAKCDYWALSFFPRSPVFRLSRKRSRVRLAKSRSVGERRIVKIEPVASVPVRCIAVDSPSHLFLAGEGMIPTHNTDGVGSNDIGWSMTEDPVNIQVTFPTREMRDKYSRDVIDAGLINATPSLRRLLPEKKSRDAGNTISYKKFPGGSLTLVAAGTGAGIRGPRVGFSWNAEVDLYKGAIGNEGDPLLLALKRCEGFPDAIKVIEGTPTIRHHSRVESWLQLSDKRMWFCPCRKCGEYQIMLWSRHNNFYLTKTLPPHAFIEWPRTGKSRLEKAVLVCGTCGATHNDPQRYQMALNGRWQPTADFNGIRGYWLNGIGTTLPPEKGFVNKLHQMAAIADLHRRAGREGLRVWVNTFLAETFLEEQDVKTAWGTLFERREEYPKLVA
jgi:hypothetical protein